jgi:uracil phosphoribosyltransferase
MKNDINTIVCEHPLCEHNLSVIRDKNSSSELFRNAVRRLTYLLLYTASQDLETEEISTVTPIRECKTRILRQDTKIILAPILRAGLIFSDVASEVLPTASIRHIGMYRDEKTLKPVWYYDKTPIMFDEPEKTVVFILDPMIATGNSALDCIKLFAGKKIPIKNIRFVSLLAAPEGLAKIRQDFPDLKIITAHIDETLNQNGYIIPGLGDAGDRIFNTVGE